MAYPWIVQQLALPQNAGVTFEQFVARQDRHVFDVWSQEFAGQSQRLVRVVAGFQGSAGYTSRVLQAIGGDFDALAVGAYFGPSAQQTATYTAQTTVDQVLNDTLASIPAVLQGLQVDRRLADQYAALLHHPIQLMAYEGGVSLIGHNQPYQPAMLAAGQSPRMYDVYRVFLTGLRSVGMDLFNQYEYTGRQVNNPWGVFGVLNYQDQPLADAPKYRALLDAVSGVLYTTAAPAGTLPALLVADQARQRDLEVSQLLTGQQPA
jgi:hypothetical protein